MRETKHSKGRKWTTDELRDFMLLWDQDTNLTDMAERFATSRAAISKMVVRLRSQGIPLKRRTKQFSHLGRRGKPWTQEEVEYLFRRRLAGDTSEKIASDLDRSTEGVHGMISLLRKQGAPIAMRGQGVRRLWSVEALKGSAIGRFDRDEIELAEQADDVN